MESASPPNLRNSAMKRPFRECIKDPNTKVPRTKMIKAGLEDEQKTNDLVAILETVRCRGKKSLSGPALPAPIAYGTYRELA
jgi:hypothetical protein